MRADGHRVESICEVLCEQGLAVAPRSYRSWKTLPACERDKGDAAVFDTLRDVRTDGPKGRPVAGGPLRTP
jgi:putative transposase